MPLHPAFANPAVGSANMQFAARPSLISRTSRAFRPRPPVRTRCTAQAPPPSTEFASLFPTPGSDSVLTLSNESASLVAHVEELSSTHAAVLIGWLRHYGCMLCKKQTADWKALAPRLRDCGNVAMVLVGNGTTEQASDFVAEMGWEGDIFTDPKRTTYAALGMRKGLASTFNIQALGKVIQSVRDGGEQTWSRLPTDAFQQGGAVLIDRKGKVVMFHADAFAGDHVPVDVLYEKTCVACKAPIET